MNKPTSPRPIPPKVLADACIKAIPSEQADTHDVGGSLGAIGVALPRNKKPDRVVELLKSGYQDSNGVAVAGIQLSGG